MEGSFVIATSRAWHVIARATIGWSGLHYSFVVLGGPIVGERDSARDIWTLRGCGRHPTRARQLGSEWDACDHIDRALDDPARRPTRVASALRGLEVDPMHPDDSQVAVRFSRRRDVHFVTMQSLYSPLSNARSVWVYSSRAARPRLVSATEVRDAGPLPVFSLVR